MIPDPSSCRVVMGGKGRARWIRDRQNLFLCPPTRRQASLGAELIGRHLARALVLHELEGDLLTFPEIAHAGALDGADVDEHVLAAVIGLNETETLGRIEPLDCADAHDESLSLRG